MTIINTLESAQQNNMQFRPNRLHKNDIFTVTALGLAETTNPDGSIRNRPMFIAKMGDFQYEFPISDLMPPMQEPYTEIMKSSEVNDALLRCTTLEHVYNTLVGKTFRVIETFDVKYDFDNRPRIKPYPILERVR